MEETTKLDLKDLDVLDTVLAEGMISVMKWATDEVCVESIPMSTNEEFIKTYVNDAYPMILHTIKRRSLFRESLRAFEKLTDTTDIVINQDNSETMLSKNKEIVDIMSDLMLVGRSLIGELRDRNEKMYATKEDLLDIEGTVICIHMVCHMYLTTRVMGIDYTKLDNWKPIIEKYVNNYPEIAATLENVYRTHSETLS